MPSKFLDKIGFEIEGGWNAKSADTPTGISPFDDITLVADHSINGQQLRGGTPIRAVHVGEAVSAPFPVDDPETWSTWLFSHWPNAAPPNRTNRTCGFHIHLSTKTAKAYTMLTSKLFLGELVQEMIKLAKVRRLPPKHPFWERFYDRNVFCKMTFNPAAQMRIVHKGGTARYGLLNFSHKMHGTVEFRGLPTFRDAPLALTFTHHYVDFTEHWLEAHIDADMTRSISIGPEGPVTQCA